MAAEAAVGFLLDKVTGVIIGYADLISGAGKEFEQLQKDVRLLKANLQTLSNSVKEIQDQVRDVIYEVEDIIDACLTQAAAVKGKGSKAKCFAKWLSPNNVSLANQVKSLRQGRVKEMLDLTKTTEPGVRKSKEEPAVATKMVRSFILRLSDT